MRHHTVFLRYKLRLQYDLTGYIPKDASDWMHDRASKILAIVPTIVIVLALVICYWQEGTKKSTYL